MKNISVIVAFAADHLDREAHQATAEDRVDDLSKLSQRVHSGDELFKLWAVAKGGRAIAIGNGDGRLEIGADHLEDLSQLKDQYDDVVGSTCSIGVGVKLSESEKALTFAQRRGGNSIELYTEELEQELASLEQPEEETKLFDAFFDKAEQPGKFEDVRGGGIHGPSQPSQQGFGGAEGEASEHSENEALGNMLENQPAPPDALGQFSQLAEESEQKEGEAKQQQAEQQQSEEEQGNLRGAVVEVLKQFKEQAPLWEQLKEAQPDAYKTLTGVMQAMIALARKAFMDEGEEGQEQPVQKSEDILAKMEPPPHANVETFLSAMKALPKEGPGRGKFITQHMNHGPFLQALQAHPQGRQVYSMLSGFLNSKVNAGVGVGAMAKALPAGAKLPLKAGGAIGDQTENVANRTAFPGSKEHAVLTDQLGGAEQVQYPRHDENDRKANWYSSHPLSDNDIGAKIADVRSANAARDPIPTPELDGNWGKENEFWTHVGRATGVNRSPVLKRKHIASVNKAALEPGKTGRHQVVLPVGSQIDPSASAGRHVSRIKVQDQTTGKTKWRQVRAGMVAAPDGSPTSSRNPNPDGK